MSDTSTNDEVLETLLHLERRAASLRQGLERWQREEAAFPSLTVLDYADGDQLTDYGLDPAEFPEGCTTVVDAIQDSMQTIKRKLALLETIFADD